MSARSLSWKQVASMSVVAASLLIAGLYSLGGAADSRAAEGCVIGGRPTSKFIPQSPRADTGLTAPVIFGCGRIAGRGVVQLVAYGSPQSVCVSVDIPSTEEATGAFCATRQVSWLSCGRAELCTGGAGYVAKGRRRYTEFNGPISSQVRKVRVRYRVGGDSREADAVVGQISGRLAEELELTEPVGAFAAVLPGCIKAKSIRVLPLGRNDHPLGRAIRIRGNPYGCREGTGGGGSFTLKIIGR